MYTNDAHPTISIAPFSPDNSSQSFAPEQPRTTSKGQGRHAETRKLLVYILDRLKNRALPPSVFSPGILGSTSGTTNSPPLRTHAVDSDEFEDDGTFSTETSFELMSQLRDVLSLSRAQGWQIFEEVSPPSLREDAQVPELLKECISILASVILEDCRFKVFLPRPSRPPFSLQAIVLDVAGFLLHIHQGNAKIVSSVAFALLPAFGTFPQEIQPRLLRFLDEDLIRRIPSLRHPSLSDTVKFIDQTIVSIHIDGGEEQNAGTIEWHPWTSTNVSTRLSTGAPRQQPSTYHISSIFPPLLAALFEHVDVLVEGDLASQARYWLSRLLRQMLSLKEDLYVDFLHVLTHDSPKVRYAAANLMSVLWPKAIGHVTVSNPIPLPHYLHLVGVVTGVNQNHPYDHQFAPWRFHTRHGQLSKDCMSCRKEIDDFGLLCPFCMSSLHPSCATSPTGIWKIKYTIKEVQQVATYRFSRILPTRKVDSHSHLIQIGRHLLEVINLFTLTLCLACKLPLWGCQMQGMKCTKCHIFLHSSCVHSLPQCSSNPPFHPEDIIIQWDQLRDSCLAFYGDNLAFTEFSLSQRSYEEMSALHSLLWIQVQIMTQGVASGTIVVFQNGRNAAHAKEHRVLPFELHDVLAWSELCLSDTDQSKVAPAMDHFFRENGVQHIDHNPMFDWSTLMYIASSLRLPAHPTPASMSTPNLSIGDPIRLQEVDEIVAPFEVASLSQLRNTLGQDFNLHSDPLALYFLSHLQHLGFFQRIDGHHSLPVDRDAGQDLACIFPLPLGMDATADVGTLFAAVESCLSDLDLSVNETGLLLLVRRLWPNGMASPHALRRSMESLVIWILSEEDRLATVLRHYLEAQNNSGRPHQVPDSNGSRSGSVNAAGDYLAARRELASRYVIPWLNALHGRDANSYASMLYELCLEFVGQSFLISEEEAGEKDDASYLDQLLRAIMKLSQALILPDVSQYLFNRWLDAVSDANLIISPIPTLARLFPPQGTSQRYSVPDDSQLETSDHFDLNPWGHLTARAKKNSLELRHALKHLCVFASSGAEAPSTSIYLAIATAMIQGETSLTSSLLFVKSVMLSVWFQSAGRLELQGIIATIHTHISYTISKIFKEGRDLDEALEFVRLSFATLLLLYSCERSKLMEHELLTAKDIEGLPSRRKVSQVRAQVHSDPVVIEPAILNAIERFIKFGSDKLSCLTARFLSLIVSELSTLEVYEIDNFILRNGLVLAKCAWHFYEIQRNEIHSLRAQFLLRTLVVDSQPFQAVLASWLDTKDSDVRIMAVSRLFRVIMDVPVFNIEGRQWRTSTVAIYESYFQTLWVEQKEDIRLAVSTFNATLLPAHLHAVSLCWDELLMKATMTERIRLISFLKKLRPYFPSWQLVSWEVVIDALADAAQNEDNKIVGHLVAAKQCHITTASKVGEKKDDVFPVSDASRLMVSLLLLALGMISDGVPADFKILLQIKEHLVRIMAFTDIRLRPAMSGQASFVEFGGVSVLPETSYPCIHELVILFDSKHPLDFGALSLGLQGQDGTSAPSLVASPFVDVLLAMFCSIRELYHLPALTLKCMLEALGIVIYKHDFEKTLLRHLKPMLRTAVTRALTLISSDISISYECQQQALSVVQAYVRKFPGALGSFIHQSVEQVAKIISSHGHITQDVLIAQAKFFIETTISSYASSGILMGLIKHPLPPTFFDVLKTATEGNSKSRQILGSPLRITLIRDTASRLAEIDHISASVFLKNLQSYIETVYYQGYTQELMQEVGQFLSNLARRLVEWSPDTLDPSPLLFICAILIQHNKTYSLDIFAFIETILKVILARLAVPTEGLSRILHVTSTLYRKIQPGQALPAVNPVLTTILEALKDGLHLKAKIHPISMRSMLEALMDSTPLAIPIEFLTSLAEPALYFLQHSRWADIHSENDFSASLAAGKVVLQALECDPSTMSMMDRASEKYSKEGTNVRAWNILALCALLNGSDNWTRLLFTGLPAVSISHNAVLRAYTQGGLGSLEASLTDINHAYIAIKIWLMLAQRGAGDRSAGIATSTVWNELWTPFEALVHMFEAEGNNGPSTLAILTWSTVADLFLFTRSLHCPIALEESAQVSLLTRLKGLGKGEAHTGKLSRALRAMAEPPPEPPFENLVNQVAKDVIAAEKLRVLSV